MRDCRRWILSGRLSHRHGDCVGGHAADQNDHGHCISRRRARRYEYVHLILSHQTRRQTGEKNLSREAGDSHSWCCNRLCQRIAGRGGSALRLIGDRAETCAEYQCYGAARSGWIR